MEHNNGTVPEGERGVSHVAVAGVWQGGEGAEISVEIVVKIPHLGAEVSTEQALTLARQTSLTYTHDGTGLVERVQKLLDVLTPYQLQANALNTYKCCLYQCYR